MTIRVQMERQVPMNTGKPRILFIDAYDSFSNNIISLLQTTLDVSIRTIKIDNPTLRYEEALSQELHHYQAVVCGPGPGHPLKEEDVGIMKKIWKLSNQQMLPVLGICLGFQSLCAEFGGGINRLKGPQHGIIREVIHIGKSEGGRDTIFEGIGDIHGTHYQSLCVNIGHDLMPEAQFREMMWRPTEQCPDLMPLAWAEWDGNEDNDSGMKDQRILVAVKHRTKPFWALQFHPESICTNSESSRIIQNWFSEAKKWHQTSRMLKVNYSPADHCAGAPTVRESLLSQFQRVVPSQEHNPWNDFCLEPVYQYRSVQLPNHVSVPDIMDVLQDPRRGQIVLESSNAHEINADAKGRYSIIALDVEIGLRFEYCKDSKIVKVFNTEDSASPEISSISLGSFGGIWPFLAQFLEKRSISNGNPDSPFWGGFMGYTTYELGLEGIDVQSKARGKAFHRRPDLSFAWVTRSLVIDHEKGLIYLQDLGRNSPGSEKTIPLWMSDAALKIEMLNLPVVQPHIRSQSFPRSSENTTSSGRSSMDQFDRSVSRLSLESTSETPRSSRESSPERTSQPASVISIKTPSDSDYEAKVLQCQEFINNGDSYELCLTDQTTVTRLRLDKHWAQPFDPYAPSQRYRKTLGSSTIELATYQWTDLSVPKIPPSAAINNEDSWSLYKTLRARQPAPFASYIRLGAATLVSASPERFLKWDENGKCELRPMKGTVRKSAAVSTLEQAERLLDVPKEKAENLMIVDLVRHDLHGICGSGNVSVPRLMVVEEYKSVFQMISIVQGQIPRTPLFPPSINSASQPVLRYTGIDVLAASLPPGSMTGAPKKRSCEILSSLESCERSLYSGVVGYMDVGGRGDWSVTIRSMFRWDDEDAEIHESKRLERGSDQRVETWHIGAGGAVTTLSTAVGEREEMQTKLNGTLGLFR